MSEIRGLNPDEVKERLAKEQYNQSPKTKTKTFGEIFVENVFSVFNLIIGSIVLFFLIFYLRSFDNRLLLDAIGLFSVALTNTLIAVRQEIKTKRVLDKVNLLLKKEVTVVRDGEQLVIPQNNIVLDDVIYMQRGDQAVVDGRILQSNYLEIDESLLTGESVPILKSTGDKILSGSFCLSGNGYYVADKVGVDSYASQVTKLAKKYKFALTPLQRRLNFIVKALFAVAIVIVILRIFLTKSGNLLAIDSIREMGTILESLVPQGLVLVSSVTFAIGTYRISRLGAIVQRLNAIESFSSVQVACMDKTGTLTQDKLAVHKLTLLSPDSEDNVKRHLGTYARLSSEKNSTIRAMEVFDFNGKAESIGEISFSSEKKMSFLEVGSGGPPTKFVLGAFDFLVDRVAPNLRNPILQKVSAHRLEFYRNLLFGTVSGDESLDDIRSNPEQFTIEPICIISITDEIREDIYDVIHLFETRGIKFKILSGDSPTTVQAVCRDIGWEISADDIVSGNELDKLNKDEFAQAVMTKMIFARLKPEHKLRVVKVLRAHKIHTAMIGDGVNDLPAIKEADLGIAMEEGSAVTKEVADIVLLKNKFSLLPQIFDEGNRIVNTVGAVAKLFLTKNFMVIYLALLSLFFLLEFPLTPRRVSLINIFAIGIPSMIIALKNKNATPYKNFIMDLFTFAGVSALAIVASGYIGFFLSKSIPGVKHPESEMVMVTIMTVLSITIFLAITAQKTEKYRFQYILYASVMLGSYFALVAATSNIGLIRIIKIFYEIETLQWKSWAIILATSLLGSLLFLLLQQLRVLYLTGGSKKNILRNSN